jgi:ABC-type Fe3+/spermidine/putrescine transport system ATPase subunit
LDLQVAPLKQSEVLFSHFSVCDQTSIGKKIKRKKKKEKEKLKGHENENKNEKKI